MKTTFHPHRLLLLCFTLLTLTSAPADIPGSADPAGVKRYEGSSIIFFKESPFESYEIPSGPYERSKAKENAGQFVLSASLKLEGKLTRTSYLGPKDRTTLEVFRNYTDSLTAAGWTTVYQQEDPTQTARLKTTFRGQPSMTFESLREARYHVATQENRTLALIVSRYPGGPTGVPKEIGPKPGDLVIAVNLMETAPMDQKMIVVPAAEMSSSLQTKGTIDLYGFYFDHNSSTLTPESNASIEEVVKMLQAEPTLRLFVVGHTDSVGAFDYNLDLSKKRAAAVVAALTARLPNANLTPHGVGSLCPIATNSTDAGKATNRRVTLVNAAP